MHGEMENIEKHKSGPAVDLEERPEPLPVLLAQCAVRDVADQAGKEAKALDRGLDFRPQPKRRDPPPAAFAGNSDLEGGIQKERISAGEEGLGIVEFLEHPQVAFEQFFASNLQRD